ncbi:MAG: PVC-type heme-binding CxxCH protein [Akkermansiaceae bacterium]
MRSITKSIILFLTLSIVTSFTAAAKKKILFLAGKPSHSNGEHEFRAGCTLLANALNESGADIEATVHYYGWPKDESIFDGVDACIIYADAGGRFGEKYAFLDQKVKEGMGIMFMHYGVHPPKAVGKKYFTNWIGAYMTDEISVNPHWIADITPDKSHPIARGMKENFTAYDEFYFNMQIPTKSECDCYHPVATAVPTPEKIIKYINMWKAEGAKCFGTKQALMWCRAPEEGKGGRGIGFVGGHYHRNWAIDEFRKLALNAIVWVARAEVPADGVQSKTITKEMLNENLDKPVEGKPIELPTAELYKQKPMKQPDLNAPKNKKKKKAAAPTADTKTIAAKDSATWEPTLPPTHVAKELFTIPNDTDNELEVTVWATSPQLYNPTNMDVDQHGRMWVLEGVNYRRKSDRREKGDRILILEDTNGDGKADSTKVFHQDPDLESPLGIGVFDNQIIVSQPPNLIIYTDVNRDLKYDPAVDKREILLSGFNARQHDHSLHSLTAGPGGKWYFNNGNCGGIFTDKSDKTFTLNGVYKGGGGKWYANNNKGGEKSSDGHVWTAGATVRMNPDGTNAEIVGHGYRNSYEQTINSLGEMFQNDNDDVASCRNSYILEYGSAGFFTREGTQMWRSTRRPGQTTGQAHWRQDDPGTFDVGDIYGHGSPTGVAFYENGALGDNWIGTYLACEAARNTIFGYHPKKKGAGYKMNRFNFTTTNLTGEYAGGDQVKQIPDQAKAEVALLFRPSDVTVGTDGAIYFTDWFDGRVGGHSTMDNSCSGTIYRIAPKGFKPNSPKFDLNTVAGQITALKSPAVNVRHLGFRLLKENKPGALAALKELLNDTNPYIAARAIWLLPHLGEEGMKACEALLKDSDANKRLVALRALRRMDINIIPFAKQLMNDPDAAVRRDVALSLRNLNPEDTKDIFVALAKNVDINDKNYIESIGLGAAKNEQIIWTAIRDSLAPKNQNPEKWSDEFATLTWRLWNPAAIPALKQRALSKKLTAAQRELAIESIAFINDPAAADALFDIAADNDAAIKTSASNWLFRNAAGEWKDMDIKKRLAETGIYDPEKITVNAITVPEDKPSDANSPERVARVLALNGDADKGKQTIMRCVMCHKVENTGPNYGPPLKGWGQTQSREAIATSIIMPSADIAHGFRSSKIILKDGKEVHGLLQQGDPYIVTSTGGMVQMIPKSKVEKVTYMKRSLMLSASQLGLSDQEVADIIAYMKTWSAE